MAALPPKKRFKTSSKTSIDTWLDAFLVLDRFSLDAMQICTRSFHRLTDERLADFCLRRLDFVSVYLLCACDGAVTNSASLCNETRRVDIKEPNMELFAAKLKDAQLSSTIGCLVVNTGKDGNIGPAVEVCKDIWSRIEVRRLSLVLTVNDDPQKCYDFVFAASAQSCCFDFARMKDEATPPYSYGQKRAPSQFFTDERLRECVAHGITSLSFESAVPADADRFPLGDDGIVDFLFGNPELKRRRGLTVGHTSVSANILKLLVQAHLESEIVEDISLDLQIDSFDPREDMDTTGFEENLLDYGEWADNRCDSSVQYEFPGEIRLQIVLLEETLQMRRGKRRGWKWMSREDRQKWLEEDGDFDNCPDENEDDEDDGFFIGHSDYTD